MYHSISDALEPRVSPYYQIITNPRVFVEHMEFLSLNRYQSITLSKAVEVLCRPDPLPEKTVVITFDDGYLDFYTHAFPVLQEHGFNASMFLPTSAIGDTSRRTFKGVECLTWSEVRELRQAGVEFGSHTVNHPELVELGWSQVELEIRNSKLEIEARLGEVISNFCYPYAFPQNQRPFTERLTSLLREAGYSCCATTRLGRIRSGDDPFCLRRLPANSLDDPELFAAKLEGAYDWLAAPQATLKQFKSLLRPARRLRPLSPDPAGVVHHS
jgi:peptidoglycan/xylan/chitin deacetylase (PgdA/CDA1 family)